MDIWLATISWVPCMCGEILLEYLICLFGCAADMIRQNFLSCQYILHEYNLLRNEGYLHAIDEIEGVFFPMFQQDVFFRGGLPTSNHRLHNGKNYRTALATASGGGASYFGKGRPRKYDSFDTMDDRLGVQFGLATVDLLRLDQKVMQLEKNSHVLNRDEWYRAIRQIVFDECHRILLAPYHDAVNMILSTSGQWKHTCLQTALDWFARELPIFEEDELNPDSAIVHWLMICLEFKETMKQKKGGKRDHDAAIACQSVARCFEDAFNVPPENRLAPNHTIDMGNNRGSKKDAMRGQADVIKYNFSTTERAFEGIKTKERFSMLKDMDAI